MCRCSACVFLDNTSMITPPCDAHDGCIHILVCCVCFRLQYVGPELDDPSTAECMQFLQQIGRENWKAFAAKVPQVGWTCTCAEQV
jgi:hypothetical protein